MAGHTRKQAVILTGNPVDGILIYGPFESMECAIEWAEETRGSIWWATELESTEQ